jgi:hypothetical protein
MQKKVLITIGCGAMISLTGMLFLSNNRKITLKSPPSNILNKTSVKNKEFSERETKKTVHEKIIASSGPTNPSDIEKHTLTEGPSYDDKTNKGNTEILVDKKLGRTPASESAKFELKLLGDKEPEPGAFQQRINGAAAILAIGKNLDKVAKLNQMSGEELKKLLTTDSTVWMDQNGHLVYIDTNHYSEKDSLNSKNEISELRAGATAMTSLGDTVNVAESDSSIATFSYHSKKGADKIIYLDFNGHTVVNSSWGSNIVAGPYDIDGNSEVFSAIELSNIKEIWQRVSEDYASFNVDVTTEEPTLDLLQKTSQLDTKYGMRALITNWNSKLCASCGGIAYINKFSHWSVSKPEYYSPAWIFTDHLGNGFPKAVGECISHEVGHTLGLNHDGQLATPTTASVEYYAGHGDDITGWAPIMGNSYRKPLTQWSKGEYLNANNKQDDLAVINVHLPFKGDVVGNTIATAKAIKVVNGKILQSGNIDTATDKDVFLLDSLTSISVTLSITPHILNPSIDIKATLFDSLGNVVLAKNGANELKVVFSPKMGIGKYFLQIQSVGKGNPLELGYTNYAGIGTYTIKQTSN